jgi:hypothetical protein
VGKAACTDLQLVLLDLTFESPDLVRHLHRRLSGNCLRTAWSRSNAYDVLLLTINQDLSEFERRCSGVSECSLLLDCCRKLSVVVLIARLRNWRLSHEGDKIGYVSEAGRTQGSCIS